MLLYKKYEIFHLNENIFFSKLSFFFNFYFDENFKFFSKIVIFLHFLILRKINYENNISYWLKWTAWK